MKNKSNLNEITKMNAFAGGFDFLENEPELYTRDDLKKVTKKIDRAQSSDLGLK